MTDSFTHLHQHTEFSMLDGAARVEEVVIAAVEDGQPALGITDHGNMYGVLDFYAACKKHGINPVVGCELYMSGESRFDHPVRKVKATEGEDDNGGSEKLYYHLTALAETNEGYKNLIKLSSEAYMTGYYYKPRVDWELLEQHHSGLIVTTGCLGGVVLQSLLADEFEKAKSLAARLQDIFGQDNLFVELQDHGIAAQHETNPRLIEIAKAIGAPLLATNDSHYVHRKDAVAHDALLCIQTGAKIADEKRFRFHGEEHYLKSAQEMRDLFRDFPEACDNTLWIAERANVEIEFGVPSLPQFPVPDEFTGDTYEDRASKWLTHLTYEGARERYGDALSQTTRERIDYELGVIIKMGFPAYFLVVWDLVRHAKESNIRIGPGRGSAAGSVVAYCLGIVDLDPMRYDLLFERFLNPGRIQMPDIDMDFDDRHRGEMIRYASERYGDDRVAQIVTFGTIKARSAVRDAARVLGVDYSVGDRIAKSMPPLMQGRDTPIAACLEKSEKYEMGYMAAADMRSMYETDPEARKVIDVAKGLEGLRRQDGIHAAAVVITDKPLTEYLPIQRKPDTKAPNGVGPVVTQYEMHGVENLGLLKMDFLGLRNLSTIERTLDLIEKRDGERFNIDKIDLADEKTLEMLRRGDSMGVFQLEGVQMRQLMRRLSPTSFDDIAALVALYRPGPMAANMHNDYADRKNGRQEISYLHPDLAPLLGDTWGLMIYQESVMRVAQKFAGYSLEEADNLRKACGKKNRAIMQAEREKFVNGCAATGYGETLGTALFDVIEPFADYAFNKSHSYGYGFISFQTAYLKCHYQVEYMAALLTSVGDDKDKTAIYLSECRALGIEVAVPDVNRSFAEFSTDYQIGKMSGVITFGLAAIRNVGHGLVNLIVAERARNGQFADFYDFANRVDAQVLNKKTIESLVLAGAFDSLGTTRKGLMGVFERITTAAVADRKTADSGVQSLFGAIEPEEASSKPRDMFGNELIEIPREEYEKAEKLSLEKEMLGLYVSDHPLMGLEPALANVIDVSIAEVKDLAASEDVGVGYAQEGSTVITGGVVTELNRRYTKKGDLMATFMLEDLQTSIQVIVFPKSLEEYAPLIREDSVITLKARIDTRDETPKLILMETRHPELVPGGAPEIRVRLLPEAAGDAAALERLKRVLKTHPGKSSVLVTVGERTFRLPSEFNVSPRSAFRSDLERMLIGIVMTAA